MQRKQRALISCAVRSATWFSHRQKSSFQAQLIFGATCNVYVKSEFWFRLPLIQQVNRAMHVNGRRNETITGNIDTAMAIKSPQKMEISYLKPLLGAWLSTPIDSLMCPT